MLEKDIENLLEKYPEEFLPNRKLTLVGRQMQLGGYRADLVFQEGPKTKVVMEIKRGLLMREAIGQIGVYYGLPLVRQTIRRDTADTCCQYNPKRDGNIFGRKTGNPDFRNTSISN